MPKERQQMTYHERIEIDPSVCGGQPVIRGTRIAVAAILNQLVSGESLRSIRKTFPDLTDDDIRAAIEFARESVNSTTRQQTRQASSSFDGLELSPEWQWVESHPDQLRRYVGEWVVVNASGIVAHSPSYAQVRDEGVAKGISVPFIFRIPEPSDSVYMGF
jgi:uncharacterized protein (DUF433 family)